MNNLDKITDRILDDARREQPLSDKLSVKAAMEDSAAFKPIASRKQTELSAAPTVVTAVRRHAVNELPAKNGRTSV